MLCPHSLFIVNMGVIATQYLLVQIFGLENLLSSSSEDKLFEAINHDDIVCRQYSSGHLRRDEEKMASYYFKYLNWNSFCCNELVWKLEEIKS